MKAILFMTQCVNSLRTRDASRRRWTRPSLVPIMACRLLGAKPLSEPMLTSSQLCIRNKIKWNINRNSNVFIKENAFENVWKMAAILFRTQCVKEVELEKTQVYASYINSPDIKQTAIVEMYIFKCYQMRHQIWRPPNISRSWHSC